MMLQSATLELEETILNIEQKEKMKVPNINKNTYVGQKDILIRNHLPGCPFAVV